MLVHDADKLEFVEGYYMKLYHMSDSLSVGTELVPDYKRNAGLAEPFVKALQLNQDVFFAMMLNAFYLERYLQNIK